MFSKFALSVGLGLSLFISGQNTALAYDTRVSDETATFATASISDHTILVVDGEAAYTVTVSSANADTEERIGKASARLSYEDPHAQQNVVASFTSTNNGKGHTFSYSLTYSGGDSIAVSDAGIVVSNPKATYDWVFGDPVPAGLSDALEVWTGRLEVFHIALDVLDDRHAATTLVGQQASNPIADCTPGCNDGYPTIWPGNNLTPSQKFENCVQNATRVRCIRECACIVRHNNWFRKQICLVDAVLAWELDLAICGADLISPFSKVAERAKSNVTTVSNSLSIVALN